MNFDVPEFLCEGVARFLNRLMIALLPSGLRAWGEAVIAEQHHIASAWKRVGCRRNRHEC
jgi:hypothetical protein